MQDGDDETGPLRPFPDGAPAERRGAPRRPARSAGGSRRRRTPPGTDAGHGDAQGHGHGHGHGPTPASSQQVRKLLTALLLPFALAAIAGSIVLYPWGTESPTSRVNQGTPVNGTVTEASVGSCLQPGQVRVGETQPNEQRCVRLDIELTDGPASGRSVHQVLPREPSTPRFAAGDDVVLSYAGANPNNAQSYRVVDFQRGMPLALLAGLFALAVVLLGRWQGMAALTALGLSFLVLAFFVLPAILAGQSPLLVAIVAAGLIMFVALYLTHGFSARTSTAVLGTMVSLCLIGVLATAFAAFSTLTGLDEGTTNLIGALGYGIDARGLLLAGVVIGALGVLDDVTVTQASAVWELRRANPRLSWRQLYAAGLRIGRDHVGSAVNTLFMAYAGAALPVLLYSSISGVGLGNILGSQDIAQEVVRTLAGSIGLVASVPVTTVLAALVASREPVPRRRANVTRSGTPSADRPGKRSASQSRRPPR
ncbi:MAG: YibE/F family protein [Pseudonocardiaceae bacterium]|nr:YibE/F family protein [Pseudonocardiaceae bacterium]